MPVLADPKRERFAQGLSRGLPCVEAYVRAGFKKNTGNATTMRKRPDVLARVEELQKLIASQNHQDLQDYLDESGINETYLIKQVMESALAAKGAGQYKVAIDGFKDVGKELFSLFIDRKTITVDQNVTNHSSATLTLQDYSANFERFSDALKNLAEIPALERIDQPGAGPLIEHEQVVIDA